MERDKRGRNMGNEAGEGSKRVRKNTRDKDLFNRTGQQYSCEGYKRGSREIEGTV